MTVVFHCETCWRKFKDGDWDSMHNWTSLNEAMHHVEATKHDVVLLVEEPPEED